MKKGKSITIFVVLLLSIFVFEIFNYSTTEYALNNLIIDSKWSTLLAIAFCGVDLVVIAKIWAPKENTEIGHLFIAWLIAISMNALLTWWGISQAMLDQHYLEGEMLQIAPIAIAFSAWLIRLILMSILPISGKNIFK